MQGIKPFDLADTTSTAYTQTVQFRAAGAPTVPCRMTHTCRWVGLVALCTLVSASAQPSEPLARERVVQSSSHSPRLTEDAGRELAECTGGGEAQRLGTEKDLSRVSKASCFNAEQAGAAEQFVNDRLNFWRRHLNLEEWQISIIMTRRDALKSKTVGGIRWDKGKKSAVISVLAASEYGLPFVEMLDDMEFTVVHELVHLELASLPRSEASRRSEEHAVNRLTDALLKLNRGKWSSRSANAAPPAAGEYTVQ